MNALADHARMEALVRMELTDTCVIVFLDTQAVTAVLIWMNVPVTPVRMEELVLTRSMDTTAPVPKDMQVRFIV